MPAALSAAQTGSRTGSRTGALPAVPRITPEHANEVRSSVEVSAISQFDNWDGRECAVSHENAAYWRAQVDEYLAKGKPTLRKHIHQIWIGNREPPCVWLDTWRVNFMGDASDEWQYTLWDNDKAAEFTDMINRDLFDQESMWQCKADIMRLEILYKYGGVYIDADMVSLGKPLDEVVDSCKDTGFLIGYEPDTKDKPYSVLGNSFIIASAGHPLLRLLIGYISAIYHHKRPYHTVEWVTGPLACTKALVHTNMPMTVPPTELFYPQFHYVPNPSAIDFSAFPKALAFQFGYTCSGLGEWIRENNRCRRAMECPYHSKKKDYPLGPLIPFPSDQSGSSRDPDTPKVIHQFRFTDRAPTRWTSTWSEAFVNANPGWTYKSWNYDSLRKLGGFFCSNMYPPEGRHMDEDTILLLALEILYKQGGYYVPLSTTYNPAAGDASTCLPLRGDIKSVDGIVGCPPASPGALSAIRACYNTGKPSLPRSVSANGSIVRQGFGDSIAAYASFPEGSRYLGASEIFFSSRTSAPRGAAGADISAMVFGYDCQVPCRMVSTEDLTAVRKCTTSAVFVTDAQMALYPNLFDVIPGFIYRAGNEFGHWDYIVVGMEWCAGRDGEDLFKACGPFRDEKMTYFAVICNDGNAAGLPETFADSNAVTETVLGHFNNKNVLIGAVRFAETEEISSIYRSMPIVEHSFHKMCGHTIPSWDRDETEIHGRLLKGLRGGQLAFEISVDEEKRIMYRAFNPDGGLNCEAKINVGPAGRHVVEYGRVFFDHTIIFEGNQIAL